MGCFIQYGVIMMKDEIVFALYKDKAIGSKDEFRRTIKKFIKDINVNEVFLRITNYQIDTYGLTLSVDIPKHTRQRCKRLAYLSSTRRRIKRNYYKNKEEE